MATVKLAAKVAWWLRPVTFASICVAWVRIIVLRQNEDRVIAGHLRWFERIVDRAVTVSAS